MKIFEMIGRFFVRLSRSSEIMQNLIFHVKLRSPTLTILPTAFYVFSSHTPENDGKDYLIDLKFDTHNY